MEAMTKLLEGAFLANVNKRKMNQRKVAKVAKVARRERVAPRTKTKG